MKRFQVGTVLVGLLLFYHSCLADWKAGVAKEIITPSEPLWMSGYASRTEPGQGKISELWAKCLVLEDADGKQAVLVTMDLVGIGRELSWSIRKELQKRQGLSLAAIRLATTHTHSGPVVGDNLRPMYSLNEDQSRRVAAYADQLRDKVVALVERALADLKPSTISWGRGRTSFAVNRRNNSEPQVETLRQSGQLRGPVDHEVPVMVIADPNGTTRVIVSGYACHATVLSLNDWCADWPGFAQTALEKKFPEATAMVWAGCGADQNPLPRRSVELAQKYGQMLAQAVEDALPRLQPVDGTLKADYAEVPLAFAHVPSRAELETTAQSTNHYESNRAQLLLSELKEQGELPHQYPYPVQVWRIGNAPPWVALGGEVVVDYALRLKSEFGPLWVTAYANDVMAYIPSERVLAEGGYEGGGAMVYYGQPSPWAPGVESNIVNEVARQLVGLGVARQKRNALYPNHADLWVFLDEQSRVQCVKDGTGWERRRQQILLGMQEAMGPLPKMETLPPLDVAVSSRERIESRAKASTELPKRSQAYDRLKLTYRADDGPRVPAYLLIPADLKERAPAMLCLHQTTTTGKEEPAGINGRATLHIADELARRGYVCLVPDYPSFGEYQPYDFKADPYVSGTMKGIVNHMRAVDVLVSRPEVDPARIGVIGHSLGGHNAMFVAAFDPRLKVIVSSCGWTPFHDYYGGKIAGWTSDRYMPRLRDEYGLDADRVPFDFYEVVAALAPRPFFSNSPLHDANFEVSGVRRTEAAAGAIYRLLGQPDNLVVRYPDSEHDFPDVMRAEAYQFIDRAFGVPAK